MRKAAYLLGALLLAACASVLSPVPSLIPPTTMVISKALPRIVAVSPQSVQQGKAASIELQGVDWAADTQVVLMSAGPYVTHHLNLPLLLLAMAFDGQQAYLATRDRQLMVVDFPPQSTAARILGQTTLADTAQALAHGNGRLLVLLADGSLQWLDVAQPAVPVVLATIGSPGKVLDMQLDAKKVYLLLALGDGKTQLQQWDFSESTPPQQKQQWTLPVAVETFVVRGQYVWTAGPEGVAVLDIAGESVVLNDTETTSGTANDVQLQDELLLVADGRGGIVLFDISSPERLQWRGSFNKRGAIEGLSISQEWVDDKSALLTLQNGSVLRVGLGNPELPSSGAAFYAGAPITFSALQGDVALLVTERSLQRVMMMGSGDGAISPEGVNLGGSRRGAFGKGEQENILFVADWFSGLHLYDISDPRRLRHLSNYHTPGSSKGVTLLGHYALVGDDDQGLQIIDIADSQHPTWTAELAPEAMAGLGLAYTMKLVGKTLYLADHRGGFHIIDLSDIKHPRRLGGYDTPGKAWDIDVENEVAFVADDRAGLLMFDVSDPANPKPFAQFDPGGQAEDVALQDGRAYVAFFDLGLYTLDISDPRQAKVIGHTPIPGNARGLELGDGLLYVASWEAGLHIVDTRSMAVPRVIGSFDTDGAAWGVKVKDGYAYVLDWWGGIKVVDVRQPSRPSYVSRYHARDPLRQLRSKDTYLYAASGAGGLQVYDIKNPLNPIWLKGLDIDGQSQDLWIEDERVYVAAGDAGIAIFDSLDPFYTHRIGGIDTPGKARLVRVGNEYAYIADTQVGLLVMDVRDPQRAVEVARHAVSVSDMWLEEQVLWLVTDTGLSGWEIADDGTLREVVKVPGSFVQVRSRGDLLIASKPSGAIKLWRQSLGKELAQGLVALGDYISGESINGLHLEEEKLYLLTSRSGLWVLDIRQPQSPRRVVVYPATGQHSQFAVARGAAFFAGETKLASVTLLPTVQLKQRAKQVQGGRVLQLPADLPLGDYHLLAVGPEGQQQLLPAAIKVQFAALGGRKFTLDAFRQLLTKPLKPPVEAVTEIPPAERTAVDTTEKPP